MNDFDKTLDTANAIMDVILISISLLQQISNKTRDQVISDIVSADMRSDELINRLR